MTTTQVDHQVVLADIFARCHQDSHFKQKFMRNPKAILADYDIHVSDETDIRVVENSDQIAHIVLPAPTEALGTLPGDEDLRRAPCQWGMCKPKGSTGN